MFLIPSREHSNKKNKKKPKRASKVHGEMTERTFYRKSKDPASVRKAATTATNHLIIDGEKAQLS